MSRSTGSNHAVLVPKTVSPRVESQSAQDEDKIVTWRDTMPDPPQLDFEDAQIGIVHQLPVLFSWHRPFSCLIAELSPRDQCFVIRA